MWRSYREVVYKVYKPKTNQQPMRNFLSSIVILAFGISTMSAQSISKKQLFYQSVDYVNCKIVEISMRNSGNTPLFTEYQQACPCTLGKNAINFDDIADFLKGEEIDKTLSLSKEINSAKKEYSSEMTDVGMVELLTIDLFKKKYGQVHAFRKNPKHNTNVEALRANLKEKLTGYIAPKFSNGFLPDEANVAAAQVPATPNTRPVPEEQSIEVTDEPLEEEGEGESRFGFLGGLLTFLSLLACVGLGLLLFQRTKKYNKLKDLYKNEKAKSKSYEQLLAQRDAEKEVYVKKVAARNRKIEELEMLLANRNQVASASVATSVAGAVIDMDVAPVQEEFYLSTPNEDGSFNDQGKSKTFKPTASLYHFVVSEKNKNLAAFAFVDDENAVMRALNYPDTCLLPVCQELNAHNIDARAIKTEEPGLVELVNDKWMLKEKARIVYV